MADEIQASEFNHAQRKAISRLVISEPLCSMPGVGQSTLDQLVLWGIIVQDGQHRHGQPTYKLTDEGNRVREALYKSNSLPR